MKPDVIYITDCSDYAPSLDGEMFCECTIDQIVYKEIKLPNGSKVKNYSCKEHGGLVMCRVIKCVDCGVEFVVGRTGRAPFRCDKHRKERRREISRRQKRKQRAKPQNDNLCAVPKPEKGTPEYLRRQASIDASGCKNRGVCLSRCSIDDKFIPWCCQCTNYKYEKPHIMMSRYDDSHLLPNLRGVGDVYKQYIWKKSA